MSQGSKSKRFIVGEKNIEHVAYLLREFINTQKYTCSQLEKVGAVSTQISNLFRKLSRDLSDKEERFLLGNSIIVTELNNNKIISVADSLDTWEIHQNSTVIFYTQEIHIKYFLVGENDERVLFRDRVIIKR